MPTLRERPPAELITRPEIAKLLDVTDTTVGRWAADGLLGEEDRIGNQYVYLRAEVERFKAEREQRNGGQS